MPEPDASSAPQSNDAPEDPSKAMERALAEEKKK
jgi:hypothetical protein